MSHTFTGCDARSSRRQSRHGLDPTRLDPIGFGSVAPVEPIELPLPSPAPQRDARTAVCEPNSR